MSALSAKLLLQPQTVSNFYASAAAASAAPVTFSASAAAASSLATSPPSASYKKPNWSRHMSITVPLYRTALDKTKNSVKYTRSLLSFVPTSVPDNIQVTHVELPRRSDILLDGMSPEEAQGSLHAEWVVHGPAVDAEWKRIRGLKSKPVSSTADTLAPSKPVENRSTITKPADETIILYCHGGAFFMGSPSTTRNLTSLFSEHSGSRVLSVAYRLAPENPFPLPLHDAVSAYLSLIDPPSGSGMTKYKPEQIVLAGDSAGGGLVIALALWIRDNGPARGWKMPAGIVALAPWLDLTHSQPSFHLNTLDYLPPIVSDPSYITKGHRSHYYTPHDSLNSHPYVSPLFASDSATDKSTHLPPTLIQLGSLERLRDEGLMFAADSFKHSPMRVELYEDMVHIFQTFATRGDKRAKDAFERIGEFVKRVGAAGVSASRAKESADGFLFVGEDCLEDIGRVGALDIVREARRELDAVNKLEKQASAPSSQSRWIQNDTSLSSKFSVSL
ncbi:hypothetical protein HDU78_009112 [Chytriomyces hyalinus]|nr:hypothetical protein HDU78_009112 [Chytriomyces hyalinus]